MKVNDCKIIPLKHITSSSGTLTFIENTEFHMCRVYYISDVPHDEFRGLHAHKKLYQLMIAVSGSFIIKLDDGQEKKTIILNNATEGLLIVPGIWRNLYSFSPGAVCLVLANENYDESDYIRDYNKFKEFKNDNGTNC